MKYKYHIIEATKNLVDDNNFSTPTEMNILRISHNAGYFSNCTVALQEIVAYFNHYKGLPDDVERAEQFMHYKSYAGENLIPYYFNEQENKIEYKNALTMRLDCMAIQFDSYRNLPFSEIKPFTDKYFTPSEDVLKFVRQFEDKYRLDYPNLCAVFYRGNDKQRETQTPSYQSFIDKAKEIKASNPNIRFLVQPDEREFLQAFVQELPDSIYFEETPMLSKQDSAMFFELPKNERPEYGAKFNAAVICISKCKHIITHSGNCGLWSALYRGNAENVYQIFKGEWL